VDLILLYDHAAEAEESDGEKALAPSHYYGRLTQRLIAAVSAPTAEGVLYDLDLRLRPSGNKGPVATHIEAFRKYQRTDAWTWEHMALTRARAVAGDASLCEEVERDVADIIGSPHEAAKVFRDAAEMRRLIAEEKPPKDGWDLKLISGGQIDIEFIAQCAVLTGNADRSHGTATASVLSTLSENFADPQARADLSAAWELYQQLTQILRLCLTGGFERADVPPGLSDLLLAASGLPDMAVLEAHIAETARLVQAHFRKLIERKSV
jgi:glutamate-ammonia-ligase adenylyltransferase